MTVAKANSIYKYSIVLLGFLYHSVTLVSCHQLTIWTVNPERLLYFLKQVGFERV